MMKCRWWDSNPHGFPNDFESFASAIPPHRLIFNFETLVPVSEDWRDVQEGCKKSCFDKPSKFNAHSWISRTDKKNHEADFESPSSAIPTHRLICNSKEHYYYSGFCAQNQDWVSGGNMWTAPGQSGQQTTGKLHSPICVALCGTVRCLMRKFGKNKELTLILQDQNDTFRTAGCKGWRLTYSGKK